MIRQIIKEQLLLEKKHHLLIVSKDLKLKQIQDFIKSFPVESVSLFETLICVIKVNEDGGCNNDYKRQEVN